MAYLYLNKQQTFKKIDIFETPTSDMMSGSLLYPSHFFTFIPDYSPKKSPGKYYSLNRSQVI